MSLSPFFTNIYTCTHTHCLFRLLPHLLLPLPLSVKSLMSILSIDLQAKFCPLPYNVLWGSPPSSSLNPCLLADIWKCFGPVLEVTVWTNRDCTSSPAMWQAFIYLCSYRPSALLWSRPPPLAPDVTSISSVCHSPSLRPTSKAARTMGTFVVILLPHTVLH